ncbi:MAG: hypothetical protein DRN07_00860, partial [Thermoplasmata archaeon]
ISLPSDNIYLDVPFESQILSKIIIDILGVENNIGQSFQSPIISAPYNAIDAVGGISLSSFSLKSSFARELVKNILLMAPPEYRILPLPKSLIKGYNFEKRKGISFHFAEKPLIDRNFLARATTYDNLKIELLNRKRFNGEYSVCSTLASSYDDKHSLWAEFLKNFSSIEIILPTQLDRLIEADIELKKFRREINEDIWIQVAHAREIQPGMQDSKDAFEDTAFKIEQDFDSILSDNYKKKEREIIVHSMLPGLLGNIKRLSQSFARAENKKSVNLSHLKNARNLIIDNFHMLQEIPEIRKIRIRADEKKKRNARYSIIRTHLIIHPGSTSKEMYKEIKDTELFKNQRDLEEFLNWLYLRPNSPISKDVNNRYYWIGQTPFP